MQSLARLAPALALAAAFAATPAAAAPPPEHPSVDQTNRMLGVAAAGGALLNSGKVVQAIDSNGYTYVQLQGCDGETWLAAPRASFTVGSTIRYGNGAVMKNFFSKALQREFPVILFVAGTEVIADQVCAK